MPLRPLVAVTASTNPERAAAAIESWAPVDTLVLQNGGDTPYLGAVPAFAQAVQRALDQNADIIACLHDDVTIHDPTWAARVVDHFARYPDCGLVGFSGALGLGDLDIYQTPYSPHQLARVDFRSNLTDAEAHGLRGLLPQRVACCDGFSLIGRRAFYAGIDRTRPGNAQVPIWTQLWRAGVIHHAYDSLLGALAHRMGWEVWYLPVSCTHAGGQTTVGDPGYQAWARTQHPDGDRGLWCRAHEVTYAWLRGTLPLRPTEDGHVDTVPAASRHHA